MGPPRGTLVLLESASNWSLKYKYFPIIKSLTIEFSITITYLLVSTPKSLMLIRLSKTWMQSQKRQNDFCSFPRQTIQYHGNPSLCPTSNTEEAEVERFYEDLQDLLELTPKTDVLFIIGDWNAKVGSQETP